MKNYCLHNLTAILIIFLFCSSSIIAQSGRDTVIDNSAMAVLIDSVAHFTEAKYVSADLGEKAGNYIRLKQEKGAYNGLSYKKLSKRLTKDLRHITNDKHMSAFYSEFKERPQESILSVKLDEYGESSNYGFVETKIFKNNTGYLKIGHFTKPTFFDQAKQAADRSMAILENTNAIIIDVRNNPGGFEEIVAYFMSYFFDGAPIYLQEYYARSIDRRRSISTTEDLPGKRLPKIPIYILINKHTGSAGESLAYLMKHLNRATIIGETTVGAGNGSNYFRVSNEFQVQIATWETINAVTKTSWEKTGVIPQIATSSKKALPTAIKLAEKSGEVYRSKLVESYNVSLNKLDQAMEKHTPGASDALIIKSMSECYAQGLLNETEINAMGYQYLNQRNKSILAETIFRVNTILFPNSANVFDSYAEALAINEHLEMSLRNYEKAVEIAKKNDDPNLALFIENLEKIKNKM